MQASIAFALVVAFVAISGAAASNHQEVSTEYPTCPLALTQWKTTQDVAGQKIETAQNAAGNYDGEGVFPSMSLFRVTLQPCGVRTMHSHANVDELLFVTEGEVSASIAFPNGTICEQGKLTQYQSFAYTQNLVHTARNQDCYKKAVVLGFFTEFKTGTVQVAPGVLKMPGGPFWAYADPKNVESLRSAVNPSTLSFDPLCLARCNLGAQGGQQPVKQLPGY